MYSECGSPTSSSLKHMFKSSICCFRSPKHELEEPLEYDYRYHNPRTPRAHDALEVKYGRCRSLFSRISSSRNRKRPYSADFRYDPLSYALNFEDDVSRENEFPARFALRLPLSPVRPSEVAIHREIVPYTRRKFD